jgi:hypothetical protein
VCSGNHKAHTNKSKLRGLSPRANYTDRATAACRRSQCQLFRIEGATWPAWRIPTAVSSDFYTGAATSSSKQLLNCTHEAEWTPFQTQLLRKSGSAGNRTRISGSVARNSGHEDHRAGQVRWGEVTWGEVTLRLTVSQSVSQYVLVWSTLVGFAARYYFLSECCCLKFAILFLWGALSDERILSK